MDALNDYYLFNNWVEYNMTEITEVDYSPSKIRQIQYWQYGMNWPVVYIIHNDKEAYVGETLDAVKRTQQHFGEPEHSKLTRIALISDQTYNKSVILDLESFLIKYMSADGKYKLQNSNAGVIDHRYFNREVYNDNFKYVWQDLRNRGIAEHSLEWIENSDLYKYSPYKALQSDQIIAIEQILQLMLEHNTTAGNNLIMVRGGAGTGKTILAVWLVKLLNEINNGKFDRDLDDIEDIRQLRHFVSTIGKLRVGFVVPMQSLRASLKNVFKSIAGLSEKMILRPEDVADSAYFDLLIVDEAHRLHQRKALSQYPPYDKANTKLALPKDATQLDWILQKSRMQILFYDESQSIRPSDIDRNTFERIANAHKCGEVELKSQLRCLGGKDPQNAGDYVRYVRDVLHEKNPEPRTMYGSYDLQFYDDANRMIKDIRDRDQQYGLARTVAGYGFEWKSQKDSTAYDLVFDGEGYKWNTVSTDWIASDNSPMEIGCIHTVQGYDLNYCGVIFGPEIYYDNTTNEIRINRKQYYDKLGFYTVESNEKLKEYIIDIYITLMTRGIRGTYIYVCDEPLREYLCRFFK